MKKLYRKGTVHPSPPTISDQLSFLPAAILTLTAALSPEDKQVLAYLISCSSTNTTADAASFSRFSPRRIPAVGGEDHAPMFSCNCFRCYMSYWVRWDSSPNRQLIHEIIDAFEDWLAQKGGKKKSKNNNGGRKEKRNKRGGSANKNQQPGESTQNNSVVLSSESNESTESESVVGESSTVEEVGDRAVEEEEEEKGSVRRFMSWIWGGWGQ